MSRSTRSTLLRTRPTIASLTAVAALLAPGLAEVTSATAASPTTSGATASARPVPRAADGGMPSGVATLTTALTSPWTFSFLPDGRSALVTEASTSKVWNVALDGSKKPVGTVPNTVKPAEDGGLLGIAPSPTWNGTSDRDVFVMHTTAADTRIAKMSYDGRTLTGYQTILSGIRKGIRHNAGKLAFGPDGYLYATTGDSFQANLAQNKNSLNGKILRITKSGAPAPGNPFGTRVYSYGHRNPQGLAWDRNGRLWSAEIGQNKADELNLIKPGKNYGWPVCEGSCGVAGMTNPKMSWAPVNATPSQIAIVRNVIYMSALRGQRLWRIPISGDSEAVSTATSYFNGTYGRLRAVAKVPGTDQLWVGTNGHGAGREKILSVTIS